MCLVKVCLSFNHLTLNMSTGRETREMMWKNTFVCLFVWPVGDCSTSFIHIFSKSFVEESPHITCSDDSWQYHLWPMQYSLSSMTSKLLWKRYGGYIHHVLLFLLKPFEFHPSSQITTSARWSQGLHTSTRSGRTMKVCSQRPRGVLALRQRC